VKPIAQTFSVPASAYKSGLFISSVDLCFRGKPTNTKLPVTIQIRPTINGYPSGSTILPFSEVTLFSKKIKISDTPDLNDDTTYTRFTFDAPVYLDTDDYALMVIANDPDFEVYTSILGDPIIGSTRVVSKQPHVGVFFKSSNASTYTPVQEEDLMFRINKCVFPVNRTGIIYMQAKSPRANVYMDVGYLASQEITYGKTSIAWGKRTTPNSSFTIDSNYDSFEANENFEESERKVILASPDGNNGKLIVKATLSTPDANISPILDLSRVSIVAIENHINNDDTDEDSTFGGNAHSRYISRSVTLADGFDSSALNVYITANKQRVCDIKVYVKVLSREDPDTFDAKSWIELTQLTSATLYSKSENDYYEYQYAMSADSDAISYLSDGVTYTTFGIYAVKVVLLSSDPTKVPKLADIRAIALPA
jgi:hypothetical protein